ncbi:hypothetical protein TNCV_1876751 [Trichonephila clavipes]|nr:hypothetical protein TNCV_1876751 [Trichonephila clavipes]
MYFFHSKTFGESSCYGLRNRQSSRIIRQSCDNFLYWISDSDCPSQNTSGVKFSRSAAFKVRPCQEVSEIRSSGIVRQSYGYFEDSVRNTPGRLFKHLGLQNPLPQAHTHPDILRIFPFPRFYAFPAIKK